MTLAKWTVTIREKKGVELKDCECEKIMESVEWLECDLESFIEERIPANLLDKIKIHVSD